MIKYKCKSDIGGCDKTTEQRCEITVDGPVPQQIEKLYMCPYNHWRSARWEEIKADAPNNMLSVSGERKETNA